MMHRVAAVAAVFVAVAATTPSQAMHQNGHVRPYGPAKVRFAPDFPRLSDTEWGFALGGFGGIRKGAPRKHAPVIFIHGNNVDHADWYLVRDDFKRAGWNDQELWGLSYNGLGNDEGNTTQRDNVEGRQEHLEMAGDQIGRIANNDLSAVPDLYQFVMAVRRYTGSNRFSMVSHSLGVTVGRKMLKVHPELRKDLVAFVGIAGGNHGTSLCPPGTETTVFACDEVAANTPWLRSLNGPNGNDETYRPGRWMTIYDSSGVADGAFAGTYAESPYLKGAENRRFPMTNHNMLRVSAPIVTIYRRFIEDADRLRATKPPALIPTETTGNQTKQPPLPETGTAGAAAGILAVAGSLALASFLRRRPT